MQSKAILAAYLSPYTTLSPADLANSEAIEQLSFAKEEGSDYYNKNGYTLVGYADVSFTPLGMKDVVANKVGALRQQAAAIRAEATAKATVIETQIQNLLAIGFDESTVFKGPTDEIPF